MLLRNTAFVVCLLAAAPAMAQDLAQRLSELYSGITLTGVTQGTSHQAHFGEAGERTSLAIGKSFATETTLLPIVSPASGFTFTYDPVLGAQSRTSQSLGPILAERAETIGKGRFFVGGSYQYFKFSTVDGVDLSGFRTILQHPDLNGNGVLDGFERDFIEADTKIDLSVSQFTIYGTYGLSNRFDVSIAAPIVRARLYTQRSLQLRYAPHDPAAAPVHTFPNGTATEPPESHVGTAAGIGDVDLRAKFKLFAGERNAVAIGSDLRLPTGDEMNLLGSGTFGVRPFITATVPIGALSPHFNVGYQINGNSVLAGNPITGSKAHLPNEFLYAVGADYALNRNVTLAADLLGQTVQNGERAVARSFSQELNGGSTYNQTSVTTLANQTYNMLDGSVGFKANIVGDLLLTGNVLFKLNNAGLRARVVPMIGLSYVR